MRFDDSTRRVRFLAVCAVTVWACDALPTRAQGAPHCPDTSLFGTRYTFGVESWQYSAAVADFNEDGTPDLGLGVFGGLVLLLGDRDAPPGGVSYERAVAHRYPGASRGIAVADFDSDSILDIAVLGPGVSLFRGLGNDGRGDGRFIHYRDVPLPDDGWDIEAADINTDGALDLVVGGYNSLLMVLLGTKTGGRPDGEFGPPNAMHSDGHLKGFELVDLDADGALDVVAATQLGWITVHRGLFGVAGPNGAFGPPILVQGQPFSESYDVAVADFDQDGKPDVASANYRTRSVSVYLGDGLAGLPVRIDHPVSGLPLGISAVDFDRDGRVDLVAAATGDAGFSFLRNHGASVQSPDGFKTYVPVGSPRTGYGIAAGDVNGDGSMDVVVPAENDTMIAVFPNSCFTDPPTATLASLVSAEGLPDRVEMTWHTSDAALRYELERREEATVWTGIATLLADGRGFLRYSDRSVTAGRRYGYRLVLLEGGRPLFLGEAWVSTPELALSLEGARPNPAFGVSCVIHYSLASAQPARLELVDLAGRRRLSRELQPVPGPASIDLALAKDLPAGIYWLRLEQAGTIRRARLVLPG